MPGEGQDEVGRAVAVEVGRGLDQRAGRSSLFLGIMASRRIQANGSRPGAEVASGRAASQIAWPVAPSRRINVSPVHSMKSALPDFSTRASAAERIRDGLSLRQTVLGRARVA